MRVQASDMAGGHAARDFPLLVRKRGDAAGRAPCCRSSGLVLAQQLGRPISQSDFRPAWLNASAAAVGWAASYLTDGPEDLEAERLFDYGLLAPLDAGAHAAWAACCAGCLRRLHPSIQPCECA